MVNLLTSMALGPDKLISTPFLIVRNYTFSFGNFFFWFRHLQEIEKLNSTHSPSYTPFAALESHCLNHKYTIFLGKFLLLFSSFRRN